MKSIISNRLTHVERLIDRLRSSGIAPITIRSKVLAVGDPIAQSVEVVLPDSADLATAQAVIDSFDPVAEQAAVDAEKDAKRIRAEKLHALAEWLRTQTKDVREKFQDLNDVWQNEFIPLRNWARTKGYPG